MSETKKRRDLARFRAALHSSAIDYDHTAHLTTGGSELAWISAGNVEEWISVDLGAASEIESVSVCWGGEYAAEYDIELSDDGESWTSFAASVGAAESTVSTVIGAVGRFVRIRCRKCAGAHYAVRKIEVFGTNDLQYTLPPLPEAEADGTQRLTGGSWKLCRASDAGADGAVLSAEGYDDRSWLPATVPGTALVSYLNAGAVPDPFFDDWQFQISEAYFTADFWYRDRFTVPESRKGQQVFLNFDSINWKADVFLNGAFLPNAIPARQHSIEGAFMRAEFDITGLVRFGEENVLAVLIHKNDTPGKVTTQGLAFGPGNNGGLLGADNPTLHASVGWDWLPTIRGRNIGITGDVRLTFGGEAEIVDPWMETSLRLISDKAANPCEDLLLSDGVRIDGDPAPLKDWRGSDGSSFTVDFGVPKTLGSVTLLWGSEAGGAAADVESRHPALFRLEVSKDGANWENFNAYPGGEIEAQFFGKLKAEPNAGSASFEGHATSDSVQGSTAFVQLDLTPFGMGVVNQGFFAPQQARFLRFTVLKRRELNGRPVDTRVRALQVFAESPDQVEQHTEHHYELDTAKADLTLRTELKNRGEQELCAELRGRIQPGNIEFSKEYTLKPGECLPAELPVTLLNPKLWWPNTYGEQFLYTAELELLTDGRISDRKRFRFGVRRFDYPVDGGMLALYCNGVRIVAKGGNWGMDDGLKRDTAKTLADKVRLHAGANMTMIRNWVGMTSHPGFYDACDQYGILIWDDFWLANPVDGPEPNDPALFLENAADKIRAVRGHAALALYCGRNEGNPNPEIHSGLEQLIGALDGTRIYFPNSASLPVGSGGGYSLATPGGNRGIKQYFDDVSSPVLRSERGIPNVPELSTLRKFLKPENLWPISEVWALHDWTYHMNGPANSYMHALQTYLGGDFEIPVDHVQGSEPQEDDPVYQAYKADIAKMCAEAGKAWSIEDFSRAAQLINYDNHRGLFDALAVRRSNGLLMWMSQSSWPSFMWQTYDYFLDTNGGYYGIKAGNQPTRAVFDPRNNGIVLCNATPNVYENAETVAEVFDLSGSLVSRQSYVTPLLRSDAFGVYAATMDFSAAGSDIVFLRLTLKDASGRVLGQNTYWHNRRVYQDYRALNEMPEAALTLAVTGVETLPTGEVRYTLRVKNGSVPALGVRIRLTDENGKDILPVFFSDNCLTLMPGEVRTVSAEADGDRVCGKPKWSVSGWNLRESGFREE